MNVYPITKNMKQEIDAEQAGDYIEAVVARLNGLHSIVSIAGKTSIMTEQPSVEFPGRVDRTFSERKDLQLLYANDLHQVGLNARGKPVIQSADRIWIESKSRNQFNQIIFDPIKPAGADIEAHVYNLWKGWPRDQSNDAKVSNKKKWRLTHDFILNVIANGDQKIFRWVLAWFAERLKHPEITAGVALVLQGDEGIGKSFFAKTVVGGCYDPQHFLHVTDQQHLLGRFNAHLAETLMVFADEAFFAADPSVKGRLYGLITESEVMLEAKFQSPIKLRNMRGFIFASNDDLVVPAGPKARRFAVLTVNETHMEDRAYFAAIAAELAGGGREEMIRYLLQEDFAGVDPFKAPLTAALMQQKELNFTGALRYWFDCLRKGQLPQTMGGAPYRAWGEAAEHWVCVDEIVSDYLAQRHMKNAHERQIRSAETELGIKLKRFIPSASKKRCRTDKGVRVGFWILPSLAQARGEFDKALGAPYAWEEGAESDAPNAGEGA